MSDIRGRFEKEMNEKVETYQDNTPNKTPLFSEYCKNKIRMPSRQKI